MSTAPVTPWGDGTTVASPPPAVQALQPLIDGATMASSPELHLLFGALAAAQGAMQNAEKNQLAKVGQGGTRMYADLAAVLAAVREPLQSQELAIVQLPLMDLSVAPPRLSVATVLGHSSGQWIGVRLDAEAPTQAGMNDLQALGNATQYLRRYGLSAITGIAQQDTDGAGSNGQPERDPRQEPAGQKLRAEIDGMLGKLTPDKAAAAENAWQDALARCRSWRRCEIASRSWPQTPHGSAIRLRSQLRHLPHRQRLRLRIPKPDHTPERSGQDQPAADGARRHPGERHRRGRAHDRR